MFALPLSPLPPLSSVLAALPRGGRFCLDGEAAHAEGRWTFVGAEPAEILAVDGRARAPLSAIDRAVGSAGPGDGGGPLDAAEVPWWVVAIAYDATWADPARASLRTAPRLSRGGRPVAWLARYETIVAIDERAGQAWILAEEEAAARALRDRIGGAARDETARVGDVVEEPARMHRARIRAALEAIAAGEIYQVNLARPWRASYRGGALPLWRAMRAASPVPLGVLLEMDARAVIARTMERFLRWDRRSGRLWTGPIKGTIARAGDDDSEARALRADDKERAEHSMIVDLMRNDLSRVARTGTVRVVDPLRVEPFAGLHHLVSTVECVTRDDVGARAILEATFPPGSVTGTPKLRAIELIEELEDTPRGLYTGALGYLDRDAGMSLAVAIRCASIEAGEATYFAGGGLVSASRVERELEETELKARVFLDALSALRESRST